MYNTFFPMILFDMIHESIYSQCIYYMCQVHMSNINYMTFPISSEIFEEQNEINLWCHDSDSQTETQISDSAEEKK